MKKIRNCHNSAVLVALLVIGILLVMGAYRIFSYLCELPAIAGTVPILLIVAAVILTVCGLVLAKVSFSQLKELHENGEL